MQKITTWVTLLIFGIASTIYFSEASAYSDVTIPLGASISASPFSLSPSVTNIKTNETVVWYNHDNTIHTVTTGTTQYGFDGRLDSGPIQPGQSFSYTFIKSGVYQYFCLFHPWMTGVVNVGVGGSVEPIYQIKLSTDKSSYQSGDKILVSGQVSKFIPNEMITVWITDSQGKGIVENHIETEDGVHFETSIPAEGKLWIPNTTYTIFAQYGSRSAVDSSQIIFEPKTSDQTTSSSSVQMGYAGTSQSTRTSYPAIHKIVLADESAYVTVQTTKHLYLPGEQVRILGSIWDGMFQKVGGAAYLVTTAEMGAGSNSVSEVVVVQVRDAQGNLVLNQPAVVDNNGVYSTTFNIPQDAVKGQYKINTAIQTKAGLLNTLDLSVSSKLGSSTDFVVSNPSQFVVKTKTGDLNVEIGSNSTIGNFKFVPDQKKVSFTVAGESGTKGITVITIPKVVLNGNLQVFIDGVLQTYNSDNVIMTSDDAATTLELSYHHSTHVVDIVGTQAAQPSTETVPEFSSTSALVFGVATLSLIATPIIFNRFKQNMITA